MHSWGSHKKIKLTSTSFYTITLNSKLKFNFLFLFIEVMILVLHKTNMHMIKNKTSFIGAIIHEGNYKTREID